MSVRGAAFLGVGAMVGAGIFALLGEAGAVAGSAVWLSFLLGGAVATLLGYVVAKLGARYPSSGGIVTFLIKGFGTGHVTGIASWLLYGPSSLTYGGTGRGRRGAPLRLGFRMVLDAQQDMTVVAEAGDGAGPASAVSPLLRRITCPPVPKALSTASASPRVMRSGMVPPGVDRSDLVDATLSQAGRVCGDVPNIATGSYDLAASSSAPRTSPC